MWTRFFWERERTWFWYMPTGCCTLPPPSEKLKIWSFCHLNLVFSEQMVRLQPWVTLTHVKNQKFKCWIWSLLGKFTYTKEDTHGVYHIPLIWLIQLSWAFSYFNNEMRGTFSGTWSSSHLVFIFWFNHWAFYQALPECKVYIYLYNNKGLMFVMNFQDWLTEPAHKNTEFIWQAFIGKRTNYCVKSNLQMYIKKHKSIYSPPWRFFWCILLVLLLFCLVGFLAWLWVVFFFFF